MTSPRDRRYRNYAVVDAHTGQVLSVHPTRQVAEANKTDKNQRVRGYTPLSSGTV